VHFDPAFVIVPHRLMAEFFYSEIRSGLPVIIQNLNKKLTQSN